MMLPASTLWSRIPDQIKVALGKCHGWREKQGRRTDTSLGQGRRGGARRAEDTKGNSDKARDRGRGNREDKKAGKLGEEATQCSTRLGAVLHTAYLHHLPCPFVLTSSVCIFVCAGSFSLEEDSSARCVVDMAARE